MAAQPAENNSVTDTSGKEVPEGQLGKISYYSN